MKIRILFLAFLYALLALSCRKKPIPPPQYPCIDFVFEHKINGTSIIMDSTLCVNEMGNKFYLSEIKYFISKVCLYQNGQIYMFGTHYVDTDYPETLLWKPSLKITEGKYDSLGFIFGLEDRENYDFRYVNPPQSAMAWPAVLGGGYHYMMLNGKYEDNNTWHPMNIHLGRGQIYQGEGTDINSIVGFIPNYFEVMLHGDIFVQNTTQIKIIMNVENWFSNPYLYNLQRWGSHIMQNQTAMQMIKENGKQDVFSMEIKN